MRLGWVPREKARKVAHMAARAHGHVLTGMPPRQPPAHMCRHLGLVDWWLVDTHKERAVVESLEPDAACQPLSPPSVRSQACTIVT
jgi:hypothetical protein